MQQIFDKQIQNSGNEKPGKFILLSDTNDSFFTEKKQEDELNNQKKKTPIVMFDFFGALNY